MQFFKSMYCAGHAIPGVIKNHMDIIISKYYELLKLQDYNNINEFINNMPHDLHEKYQNHFDNFHKEICSKLIIALYKYLEVLKKIKEHCFQESTKNNCNYLFVQREKAYQKNIKQIDEDPNLCQEKKDQLRIIEKGYIENIRKELYTPITIEGIKQLEEIIDLTCFEKK